MVGLRAAAAAAASDKLRWALQRTLASFAPCGRDAVAVSVAKCWEWHCRGNRGEELRESCA